ncbi:MAG: ABC transporter substrate-binding protein, partial [Proteobacteria bacterium]|nr:ABC transporter substrate-binding protein [Pseudomonadota bacterium]
MRRPHAAISSVTGVLLERGRSISPVPRLDRMHTRTDLRFLNQHASDQAPEGWYGRVHARWPSARSGEPVRTVPWLVIGCTRTRSGSLMPACRRPAIGSRDEAVAERTALGIVVLTGGKGQFSMERRHTRESILRAGTVGTMAAVAAGLGGMEAGVAAAQGAPADVPRNRTLQIVGGGSGGKFSDAGIGNPYAPGATHQIGNAALWEGLFYYSAFADEMIPWLATGYTYTEDFSGLTVNIRKGVEWGDGKPFTARDVEFTFNLLKGNLKLSYAADMQKYVASVSAIDDLTVKFTFTAPNPRFLFEYLAFKFDNGVKLLPKHIFEGQDPTEFTWFDLAKGWPCGTGPYRITLWTETQKFMDLRQDWWGAKTGFLPLPLVERILFVPFSDDNRLALLMANNEGDLGFTLLPQIIKPLVEKNKQIISHTFNRPPYGYVDWWPNSLWVNTQREPWNDPDIRWALSYAINRPQVIEVGYEGAGVPTEIPYPAYPALLPYFDSVKDLLKKYPTNKFDLGEVTKRMTAKGYAKDSAGFWSKGGKRIVVEILGFSIWATSGPILAEQLRAAGFESMYNQPQDWTNRALSGEHPGAWLFGHGASIADPYYTLYLYSSVNSVPQANTSAGGG